MVPKEGKGKYNITVPQPYEFDSREKTKEKTIREQKLEEMLREKELKETAHKAIVFRANDIPRTTKEPLYEKLMRQ